MKHLHQTSCVLILLLLCSTARASVAPERIHQAIESSPSIALPANIPAAAQRATDLGAVPDDVVLSDLSLRFNITLQQETALRQLLQDQQNPKSSRFHQWLTPEQFGAEFGLAASDLQKISDWLTGQGFKVTEIARGGLFLRFTGSAATVNRAFGVQLHRLTLNGETHIANLTAPHLPAEVANLTSAITGLHDFRVKPVDRHNPKTSPDYTYGSGVNIEHGLVPADFYTIYDENSVLAAGVDGSGITIALVGQSDLEAGVLDDVAAFRVATGLKPNTPTQVLYGQDPGVSPFDETESIIDMEWSGAGAPGAKVILARGVDAFNDALTGVIDNNLAPIVSSSYAGCEAEDSYSQSIIDSFYPLFLMANAQGQTIVNASGDASAAACMANIPPEPGLSVNFPASSPLVTAVGGTQFPGDCIPGQLGGTSDAYFSATNGPYGGSALSYVPEQAWCQSTGGVSRYYAKPSWQIGPGVPSDFGRDVPDVALYASGYLVCGVSVCGNGVPNASDPNISDYFGGGTSFSAPLFAGLLALVEQQTGSRIGNANPTIYALANSSYSTSVFHDITTGSNAAFCQPGTSDCPVGPQLGYPAAAGYDLVTGWGSVDVAQLVKNWVNVTPLGSSGGTALSDLDLTASAVTVTQGAPIVLSATVTSPVATNQPNPTGTVQFLLDSVPVGSPIPLAAGVATYSLITGNVRLVHTVQAAYSGDSIFAGSRNAVGITVNPVSAAAPTVTLVTGSTQPFVQGTIVSYVAHVSPASGATSGIPTGTVQFLLDGAPYLGDILLSGGVANLFYDTTYDTGPGSHTISAVYLGDSNFSGSQNSIALTLIGPPPDFTMSPTTVTATAKSGSSVMESFTFQSINGFSGNVQLSSTSSDVSFILNPVPIGAGSSYTTVVQLNAYTRTASATPAVNPWYRDTPPVLLAGVTILLCLKRRRFQSLLALAVSVGLMFSSGCGTGAAATKTSQPTQTPMTPGTYTIPIMATGTSGTTVVTHTATVTFIVN